MRGVLALQQQQRGSLGSDCVSSGPLWSVRGGGEVGVVMLANLGAVTLAGVVFVGSLVPDGAGYMWIVGSDVRGGCMW